jgi:hypothetical protein
MTEKVEKGKWLAEYKCGCTDVAVRKSDLLEYCEKHGENRLRIYKLVRKTETGLA